MVVAQLVNAFTRLLGGIYTQTELLLGSLGASVAFLAIGIAFYAIIVGTFYMILSKRALFSLDLNTHFKGNKGVIEKALRIFSFVISYTIIFPLITFIWFLLLSFLLYYLSKTTSLQTVLITSLAVVLAIRICAYFKEEVAVDLAKLLPLALLGVFIVEPSYFSGHLFEEKAQDIIRALPQFLPLLGFTIVIEWSLRIILAIKRTFIPAEKPQKDKRKLNPKKAV